jgi:putative membrane protein
MTIRPDNPHDEPKATTAATPEPASTGDLSQREEHEPATSPAADAQTERTASPGTPAPERVPSTRASTAWVALCATAVVLVALIVFLLQNTRSVQVSFLWMEGAAPLAVTLLIAAVGAALITALLGTLRITQLRRVARHRPASRGH